LEIAGSPRNILTYSLLGAYCGVEHSMGTGGFLLYQTQGNSENIIFDLKESVPGCEGPGTKGKQPRSLNKALKKKLSEKKTYYVETAKRWAWKQPSLRESVIAQWSK